ncbi:related to 60S ribosomal protein L36 [Armillaria ostoyae]|uniref:Related to 60S ribosomal protein L36 n=6 Tax=Physalacriaceae TaxID=862241 RepID=A0A284R053_ARMOS|nr:related to 60S ribosomal protein L36 [Armillaria ostoyae]
MNNLIEVWEDYASNYTAAATIARDYTRVKPNFTVAARRYPQDPDKMTRTNLRTGLNKGHPTTPIEKAVRPSQRKGIQSAKTKFVRSVVREVAGFSAYERRVMELLRNSKDKKARKLTKKRLGTLLRSKRKLEELSTIIQESRRAGH